MSGSGRRVRESFLEKLVSSLRSGFGEVWRNNLGKVGLLILVVIIVISIYALATVPPDLPTKWKNRLAWSEYPTMVPPEWVKYLGVPVAEHRIYTGMEPMYSGVITPNNIKAVIPEYLNALGAQQTIIGYTEIYRVEYELSDEAFPMGILTLFKPINNSVIVDRGANRTIQVLPIILVSRPDGLNIIVGQESSPVKITDLAFKNVTVVADIFWLDYVNYYSKQGIQLNMTPVDARSFAPKMIFGKPVGPKDFEPVTGTYNIYLILVYLGAHPKTIQQAIENGLIGFEQVKIVVKGNAYGVFGTDNMGRDLWLAILYGFPVAVAVGLFAAVTSVIIGLVVGVVSGYYGGLIDEFIQRVIDVLGNIPVLPILILIGIVLQERPDVGPWEKLFIIIGFLVLLSWGGLAIIVRSMTLSIKAEPYIDAARAVGASNARIIFRHIIPQILPYAMASLVFSVPGAIITEAGLSVLGIEHGLPTWGKVLADAQANRGVAYKMWWWILPPGAMLAITSLAFVLIGLAIETIVEPRLRR
ncbi:MAG: ABC transporter permease [Desulfurococcales archaeon]|nr:ABC transporter permease [Desulfurococcales archaeon]